MTYHELLIDSRWQNKRIEILKRDSLQCQVCYNKVYQKDFSAGLIISNTLNHGGSPNAIYKDKHIIPIWDIEQDIVITTFLGTDTTFNPNKSYVAYYDNSKNYANIVALREFDTKHIKFNKIFSELWRKGKFAETTRQMIYRPINKDDIWTFIKGLHIHHTYYQEGLLPWEYPNKSLITLCWTCHEKRHQNGSTLVYDANGIEKGKITYCYRCYGAGVFPEYLHVEAGVCFRCHGARYEEYIT